MESAAGAGGPDKDATRKHYNPGTHAHVRVSMTTRLFVALAGALLIVRLPSLAQPMGADQGLYAYVGERIRHGGVPYVDAWDQKPPAIHYTYAALRAIWPR